MIKRFFLGLILITPFTTCYGYEIVYPNSLEMNISSDSTFFVGNQEVGKSLLINDEEIKLNKDGAFFYPVKLEKGENIFIIKDNKKKSVYKITNTKSDNAERKDTPIKTFDEEIVVVTNTDNVPLRSMPYDGGVNRLQHLQKGIPLIIVGEKDGFYKVKLSVDDFVWVAKDKVDKVSTVDDCPVQILNYSYDETLQKYVYRLKLTKNTPYILSECRDFFINDENNFIPISTGFDLVVYDVEGFEDNKYKYHIELNGKTFGYKSYFTEANELVIEIKKTPCLCQENPLNGLKITIDAGHGGAELGAVGCLGDYEKDINLAIAKFLKDKLEQRGAIVVMTRDNDVEVSLNDRVKLSNDNNADVFISIHNNSIPDNQAFTNPTGTNTYYFYNQSALLSQTLLDVISENLGTKKGKSQAQSFAVVRNTESLAVLLEIAYMITPEDNAKLMSAEFQEKTADAILKGLEKYFSEL